MTNETSLCHSIFFGGGTPTVLSGEELAGILEEIRTHVILEKDAEITTEANPCTVDEEKLRILKNAGFNRISIGAQSMNDGNLKMLGRLHDRETFRKAFEAARRAGFDNINLDMISGLPGQRLSDWENEIREAAAYGSEHISAYSLELYEGTPLFRQKDKYAWPADDELAQMYERTGEILREYGFERYELSNYSKPGYECRHNTGYWTGDEYLGFGIGAASFENNKRYSNTSDIRIYLNTMNGSSDQHTMNGSPDLNAIRTGLQELDKKDLETEYMILGLRLTRGVSIAGFEERFGEAIEDVYGDVINKYLNMGFMELDGDRLRLREKALFVSNSILAEFIK